MKFGTWLSLNLICLFPGSFKNSGNFQHNIVVIPPFSIKGLFLGTPKAGKYFLNSVNDASKYREQGRPCGFDGKFFSDFSLPI